MIPGSNILAQAMGPIARQTLQHRAFISRALNAAGDWEDTFADPVPVTGSWQPINRKAYQLLGLNLEKSYFNFYTSANVLPLGPERAGDLLIFAGKLYQAQSDQPWIAVDGWRKLLCVEVETP